MLKLVSVVIPMYNAQNHILRCLKSVLNQTYKNLEVIVVNDGSKDNSELLVNEFINKHPELKIVLINKPNGGVSSARNLGIKSAKGEYIALLDADDEWLSQKLTLQLDILSKYPEIDFIGSSRNQESVTFPYSVKNGLVNVTLRKLLLKIKPATSTAVFKTSIRETVGFYDETQRYSEDANYWMRISIKHRMVYLPDSLVVTGGGKFNYGVAGLSANVVEMAKGEQKNILEMFKMRYISLPEFLFFYCFALIKYMKRILVVKLRK